MDIIQAEFNESQIEEIQRFAAAMNMSVEEFVETATRKLVAEAKDHVKEQLKPRLKVVK